MKSDEPRKQALLKLPKQWPGIVTMTDPVKGRVRKLSVRWTLENPSEVIVGEDGITRYVWH